MWKTFPFETRTKKKTSQHKKKSDRGNNCTFDGLESNKNSQWTINHIGFCLKTMLNTYQFYGSSTTKDKTSVILEVENNQLLSMN